MSGWEAEWSKAKSRRLGGSEKVQNLKKVKIREHIELISQLVGKIGMIIYD